MHATAATTTPWYYLPQFRPVRLQDCVLWLESHSFNAGIWRNLAPNFSDRNHGMASGGVGLHTWHPLFAPTPTFYGDDEYVDCGSDDSLKLGLAGSNGLSLEAWVIPGSTAITDAVIVKNGSLKYGLTYHNATNLYFYITTGSNGVALQLSYDVLHHVVGTWDGTTNTNGMKLYFDGVLVRQKTSKYDSTGATGPVLVGGTNSFDGPIPAVRIYKGPLSPAEIRHNYTHHPLYYLQRGIDPYEVLTAATAASAPSI